MFAEDLCGIFVKSVIEGSMADVSGCITVNDQITEVRFSKFDTRVESFILGYEFSYLGMNFHTWA
jgi:C-terminal processing protease CtpA/Prc